MKNRPLPKQTQIDIVESTIKHYEECSVDENLSDIQRREAQYHLNEYKNWLQKLINLVF